MTLRTRVPQFLDGGLSGGTSGGSKFMGVKRFLVQIFEESTFLDYNYLERDT